MPKKSNQSVHAAAPSEFLWLREKTPGYSIVEGTVCSDDRIQLMGNGIEKFLIRSENVSTQIEYAPGIENPFLYREFAHSNRDSEAILIFARRYGVLGLKEQEFQVANGKGTKTILGTEVRLWFECMNDILETISLWESYISPDPERLKRHLRWHKDKESQILMYHSFANEGSSTIVADSRHDAPLVEEMLTCSLREQALYVIKNQVNKYFINHTSARICIDKSRSVKTLSNSATPKNLLGWIWFQIAREVNREMVYFECLNCGKPVLKPVTRGQPSKSCSDSCRVQISQRKLKTKTQF